VVFILGCVLAAGVGADTGAELVGVSGRGSPSAEVTATDWQGASSRQRADQCRGIAVSQSGSGQDGAWAKKQQLWASERSDDREGDDAVAED
jgi:hypothetical protein